MNGYLDLNLCQHPSEPTNNNTRLQPSNTKTPTRFLAHPGASVIPLSVELWPTSRRPTNLSVRLPRYATLITLITGRRWPLAGRAPQAQRCTHERHWCDDYWQIDIATYLNFRSKGRAF